MKTLQYKSRHCAVRLMVALFFYLAACSPVNETLPILPSPTQAAQRLTDSTLSPDSSPYAATQPFRSSFHATDTPFPTHTPYPVTLPAPAEKNPCYRALFIADVTYPDGTFIAPGISFDKVWRIRNDGLCEWTTDFQLIPAGGDDLQPPAAVKFPHAVPPGQEIDLKVSLKAPIEAGTFKTAWKLQTSGGEVFGLGNTHQVLYVLVNVLKPEVIFAVTNVVAHAEPAAWNQDCPYQIRLMADITVTKAGEVTCFWEDSQGQKSETRRLVFNQAGTLTMSDRVTGGKKGSRLQETWRLYIDEPNHQYFSPVTVTITCP